MIKHISDKIQNAIQMELFKAKVSIKIAVAWFTNELLLQPLILKLQNGVSVELIINDDEINRNGDTSLDFTEFLKAGGVLRWNDSKQLMHEKFCIIDNRIVITGSYNWTNKAEYNSEVENIFYDEAETTRFYNELYNKLSVRFEQEIYVGNSDKKEISGTKSYYDEEGFFIDEFGAKYSNDKKRLIKVPGDELVLKFNRDVLHLSGKCPTSYHIPDGVVVIEDGAFTVCACLKDVYIPNTVTTIGIGAFSECRALTSIRIPNSVTSIGRRAFYNSGLESIRIPDSVKMIAEGTFENCDSLASVHIPNSVTAIGDSAFYWCTNLKSVKIPDSVISLGNSAFGCCKKLTSIDMSNNIRTIGDSTFYGCESLVTFNIPDSVTTIGKEAFCLCTRLRSIIIPDDVKSIGDQAFWYTDLTSINIPESVINIGDGAIGNTRIGTIYIPAEGNSKFEKITAGWNMYGKKLVTYYGIDDLLKIVYDYELEDAWTDEFGAKYSQDKMRLLKGPANGISNYSIRNGTKIICNKAFYDCYKLTFVHIPDSVTCIGEGAFSGCLHLTTIHIPDSVLNIGGQAFFCCNNLTSIRLSNNLTSIGVLAFGNCKAIKSIIIPDSVTRIGRSIFIGCDNLSAIYIPVGTKNIMEKMLPQYKDKLIEK